MVGLSNLYHEDAYNHLVNTVPLIWRIAINKMFINELDQTDMICEIENIFEDKDCGMDEIK